MQVSCWQQTLTYEIFKSIRNHAKNEHILRNFVNKTAVFDEYLGILLVSIGSPDVGKNY